MKKLFFICCLSAIAATASAQALKVATDYIELSKQTIINIPTESDGFDLIVKPPFNPILPNGADLFWGSFYQAQPNNPGLFSLTSVSAPVGPFCFTIRANL